jgi:hypothetical protein
MSKEAASPSSSPVPLPLATRISSTGNPYIKHCIKLRENARYRQQQQRVLLVGSNLLKELAGTALSSPSRYCVQLAHHNKSWLATCFAKWHVP